MPSSRVSEAVSCVPVGTPAGHCSEAVALPLLSVVKVVVLSWPSGPVTATVKPVFGASPV